MKKFLSVFLTVMMLVMPVAEMTAFAAPSIVTASDETVEPVGMPVSQEAALASETGWCGAVADNLTWSLDDEGTLTISGTGEMATWYNEYDIPWYDSRLSIKKLVN